MLVQRYSKWSLSLIGLLVFYDLDPFSKSGNSSRVQSDSEKVEFCCVEVAVLPTALKKGSFFSRFCVALKS